MALEEDRPDYSQNSCGFADDIAAAAAAAAMPLTPTVEHVEYVEYVVDDDEW